MSKKKLAGILLSLLLFVVGVFLLKDYSSTWLFRGFLGFGMFAIIILWLALPGALRHDRAVEWANERVEEMEEKVRKAEKERDEAFEEKKEALEQKKEAEEDLEELSEALGKLKEEQEREAWEKAQEKAERKAERKARELFEEKNEEWLEEKEQELREKIRRKEREKAEKKIEEARKRAEEKIERVKEDRGDAQRKLIDFVRAVFGDWELADILLRDEMNVDRFVVVLAAAEDEDLEDELKKADRLGDVDTVIKARADRIKENAFEKGLASKVRQALSGKEEEVKEDIGEKIDETSKGILAARSNGKRGSGEIADHLDVSKSTVKKRYPKLKDLGLIETKEGSGIRLTPKGRKIVGKTGT